MQPANRVAVNTGYLYARMAVTVFISLYTTRLILAALGASDYGIFNVIAGAVAMLTFLNAAMSSATQRFMSYAQGEGKHEKQIHIFNASIVLHAIIGILVVLMLEGAGYFLFNGILKIPEGRMAVAKLVFQFMLVSTYFSILSVPYNAVITAHENMLFVAILGIVQSLIKLVIALYITYTSYDHLIAYGLLMILLSLILLFIQHMYCTSRYDEVKIHILKYHDTSIFKEMTSFAGWQFFASTTSMVTTYGQGIVLNMFFGPIANAAQGIATQVSGQLKTFSNNMLRALNPVIDKSEGAGNRVKMLKSATFGSKISFFLLVPFYIPVLIDMPFIFSIWLKNVPNYAVIFCRLLLIRDLIDQLFITLNSSIGAVGDIRQFKLTESFVHLLPLIICYIIFLYGYPAYSLYIIFIIYSIIFGGVVLYFSNKVCGLSISSFVKNIVLRSVMIFVIVLFVSVIPVYFINNNIFLLFAIILVSFSSFLITTWFIGLDKYEKYVLRKIFFSFKNMLIGNGIWKYRL